MAADLQRNEHPGLTDLQHFVNLRPPPTVIEFEIGDPCAVITDYQHV